MSTTKEELDFSMVAMKAQNTLVGMGLYTPSEAALFARIHPATMSRWLHGTKTRNSVLKSQLETSESKIVTFLDLVQALAIRAIRLQFKVSLQTIRDAVVTAKNDFDVLYPFAQKHKTFLFDNEIIIQLDKDMVQISGKGKNQKLMRPVTELYMKDISFDAEGLAKEYRAFEYRSRVITMNPKIRFGHPIIGGCDYSATVLNDAVQAEGSIEAAAKAFDVSIEDVETAVRFYDHLQGPAVA